MRQLNMFDINLLLRLHRISYTSCAGSTSKGETVISFTVDLDPKLVVSFGDGETGYTLLQVINADTGEIVSVEDFNKAVLEESKREARKGFDFPDEDSPCQVAGI